MHEATESIILDFDTVENVEMSALGDIKKCHDDSGFPWTTKRITIIVNGKTYFRLAWEHRHALSLFGTAPRARVRPNHSSPIDPVRHQHQIFIATECIPFPISGSRCRGAFLFLFQAIDAGHLVYITVQFPQH